MNGRYPCALDRFDCFSRATPGRPANRWIRRLLISLAAFSVNVMARMASGSTPCVSTNQAKRSVSTRVLPEPGPATTHTSCPMRSTARRWSSESVMSLLYEDSRFHATDIAEIAPAALVRIRGPNGDVTGRDRFVNTYRRAFSIVDERSQELARGRCPQRFKTGNAHVPAVPSHVFSQAAEEHRQPGRARTCARQPPDISRPAPGDRRRYPPHARESCCPRCICSQSPALDCLGRHPDGRCGP